MFEKCPRSGNAVCVLSALCIVSQLSTGCATSGAKYDNSPISVLTTPVQSVDGPKRIVAVGQFASIGALEANYGEWDLGGGMAAMLTTALVESKQFIVLERAQLDAILQEHQMAGEGVVAKGMAVPLGQLYGAQLLIFGAVTEFGDDFKGGGASGSYAGAKAGRPEGGAAASEYSRGKIGLDIRIADTQTGAVVASFRVEEPITKKSVDTSLDLGVYSIGGNAFMRTPTGDATRRAITKVVEKIIAAAGDRKWTGKVVDVEDFEIAINAGAKSGISVGDRFSIERVTKEFTDPVTGRLLSERKKELGLIEVNVVEKEIAYGTYQPFASEQPQRGDLVVVIE